MSAHQRPLPSHRVLFRGWVECRGLKGPQGNGKRRRERARFPLGELPAHATASVDLLDHAESQEVVPRIQKAGHEAPAADLDGSGERPASAHRWWPLGRSGGGISSAPAGQTPESGRQAPSPARPEGRRRERPPRVERI